MNAKNEYPRSMCEYLTKEKCNKHNLGLHRQPNQPKLPEYIMNRCCFINEDKIYTPDQSDQLGETKSETLVLLSDHKHVYYTDQNHVYSSDATYAKHYECYKLHMSSKEKDYKMDKNISLAYNSRNI